MSTKFISRLLSFNGGFVDTLGFLAFNGLFTAHVTGNFVTIGAAIVSGASGVVTKLLALPIFCLVIIAARMMSYRIASRGGNDLRALWIMHILLLILSAIVVTSSWPINLNDSPAMMISGLSLVAAMAIQNAIHKTHLTSEAPSTLMTGSTTQIMVDIADYFHRRKDKEDRADLIKRMKKLSIAVVFFALGCIAAALAYLSLEKWSFVLPAAIALSVYSSMSVAKS